MDPDQESNVPPRKTIKVNSIKHPTLKKILKPCEARAGHGAISVLIGLAVIGVLIAFLIRGIAWVYNWITS